MEGGFDLAEQLPFALQPPQLALHFGPLREQGVAAAQALALALERRAPLIDGRDVLREQRAAAAYRIGLEQGCRNRARAKGPGVVFGLGGVFQHAYGGRLQRPGRGRGELDAVFGAQELQVKGQVPERIDVPGIRGQKAQVKRQLEGRDGEHAVHERDVRGERDDMPQRIEHAVYRADAHQDANRNQGAPELPARGKEERCKEENQQHGAPRRERVVAKRVAVVALPRGVLEAELKNKVVPVVRQHERDKRGRYRGRDCTRQAPGTRAVDGRGAQRAGEAESGYGAHGDIEAVPQDRYGKVVIDGVLDQHDEHPECDQRRYGEQIAADGGIGATQVDREPPSGGDGTEQHHVTDGRIRPHR